MFFDWLNPWMLAALAAVSIPLIIELLHRLRRRVILFPAMRYLQREKQKKVRMQDLLLLILRSALIFLLVLALARPFLKAGSMLWAGGANRDVVLVFDTTYSTGQRVGATTALENGKKFADEVIRGMATPPKITLVTLGHKAETLLERSRDLSEVRSQIERLRVSDGSARMGEALALVERLMAEKGLAGAEVYIFSDMQKSTWSARQGEGHGAAELIDKLSGHCQFIVADAGGEPDQPNYYLTRFEPREKVMSAGMENVFDVRVEGKGPGASEGEVKLTLWVNDQKQAEKTCTLVQGGAETTFNYSFLNGGDYFMKIVLEGDRLPVDNKRYYFCRVPESLRVLILDESAELPAGERPSRFLKGAIAPAPWPGFDRMTPFTAVVRRPEDLAREDLSLDPIVVLAGVRNLSKPLVTRLDQYVRDGGRLLIFAGEGLESYTYNSSFFLDGKGILPGTLGSVTGEPAPGSEAGNLFLSFAPPLDAAFASFKGRAKFDEGPIFRRLPMPEKDIQAAGARTLLKLTDGSPVVAEKAAGRGRVMLVGTSADGRWNYLPLSRDFPVLVQALLRDLVGNPDVAVNLSIGDRFEQPVMLSSQHLILITPAGDKVRVTPVQEPGQKEWKASFAETGQQGLYKFDASTEALDRARFVVNLRPEEGDLARFTEAEFRGRCRAASLEYVDSPSRIKRLVESLHSRKELAVAILWILLGLLLVETFLAKRFGMRRA